jgi:hypothetical protein
MIMIAPDLMGLDLLPAFGFDLDLLPAVGVWRRPRRRQGQALRVAYGQP